MLARTRQEVRGSEAGGGRSEENDGKLSGAVSSQLQPLGDQSYWITGFAKRF